MLRQTIAFVALLGLAACAAEPIWAPEAEVQAAVDILADIMKNRLWDRPEYKARAKVT